MVQAKPIGHCMHLVAAQQLTFVGFCKVKLQDIVHIPKIEQAALSEENTNEAFKESQRKLNGPFPKICSLILPITTLLPILPKK